MPTSPKMYRQNQILRSIPSYIVAIFGVVICGTLAVSSLFSLAIMQLGAAENELPEQLILASRNTLHVVPIVILLSIVFLFLNCQNISWKAANILTLTAASIQSILALWWKFSFKSSPVADQGTFWDVATVLAGQRSSNDAFIDYLRYWPFQAAAGMTGEPFARLFHGSYGAWQIFNCICVGGCVILLCCICGRITGSAQAKAGCAVLVTGFFPLSMYSTFIYGTLSGSAAALLGIYAVIRQCTTTHSKKPAFAWWLVAVISLTAAITFYTGMQIFLVAAVLILLTTGFLQKEHRTCIPAALLLLVLALSFQHSWQVLALHRLGTGNEPGCPILPRIAMGVDAYTDVTPGFYNNVNAGIYYGSNFTPSVANKTASDYIVKCLNELWTSGRFGPFFYEKTADQWLEPWFGGLTMNNPSIFCEQKWLARSLTSGKLFAPVHTWLSMLLSVVYVWSTVGVVALLRRHKQQVWQLSLVVCLIGGFLFQLAAEAKARYCLPYYLCCFPLAAAGLFFTAKHIASHRQKKIVSAK